MNNISRKMLIFAAALCVFSCASGSVIISDELSSAELIQRAQEASDKNRYKTALQYYQALYDRNATNIDLICVAEYEIAFIHYKQKKYAQARAEFNALLERYNALNAENLPQQFKLLTHKVLERIDEKEKPRKLFSRKT
jgi:outer membrane protein assembly factor BamD (BamD/ComL family)